MKSFAMNTVGWLIFGVCICCAKPAQVPAPIFSAQVYFKTTNDSDLLNPQTSGYFSPDGIKVFDVVANENGVLKNSAASFNTYGPSSCNGYVCQPYNNGLYSIQFVVRPTSNLKQELIQLNSSITDTLTYQIIPASQQVGYYVDKVYYKGQVMWSRGTSTPAVITIVK